MPIEDMARRSLDRAGESATVTTYEDTGDRDDYGDPLFTENETTVDAALFRQPSQGDIQTARDAGGNIVDLNATIYVDNTEVPATDVNAASDATPKASIVTRDRTGQTFVVLDVWDESNGLLRLGCVKEND